MIEKRKFGRVWVPKKVHQIHRNETMAHQRNCRVSMVTEKQRSKIRSTTVTIFYIGTIWTLQIEKSNLLKVIFPGRDRYGSIRLAERITNIYKFMGLKLFVFDI